MHSLTQTNTFQKEEKRAIHGRLVNIIPVCDCHVITGFSLWRPDSEQNSVASGNLSTLNSFGETFMDTVCKNACSGHDVARVSCPCIHAASPIHHLLFTTCQWCIRIFYKGAKQLLRNFGRKGRSYLAILTTCIYLKGAKVWQGRQIAQKAHLSTYGKPSQRLVRHTLGLALRARIDRFKSYFVRWELSLPTLVARGHGQ